MTFDFPEGADRARRSKPGFSKKMVKIAFRAGLRDRILSTDIVRAQARRAPTGF
ncbi:MAG: hypothetical protein SAK29_38825 [Scytonema sp. PMC 1069.18]|nr:hypothetical protein [Scytonema sp. PMC 1069.18]MEC4887559.1 hypothetical protein [Scytonema sp. PMC 1070.18]